MTTSQTHSDKLAAVAGLLAAFGLSPNGQLAREYYSQKVVKNPEDNPALTAAQHVIQAMACHRLGELEAARSELTLGRDLIQTEFENGLEPGNGSMGYWFDWFFARILLREAEDVFGQK